MNDPENQIHESLVRYAFDMLDYAQDYEQYTWELYQAKNETTIKEVELVLEEQIGELICGDCSNEKLFDSGQRSFYCPVCE